MLDLLVDGHIREGGNVQVVRTFGLCMSPLCMLVCVHSGAAPWLFSCPLNIVLVYF